jgi:hypothetical protein
MRNILRLVSLRGGMSTIFRRLNLRLIFAVAIILSLAISGCAVNSSVGSSYEAPPPPALSPTDMNLIFVVTPDLEHNAGDINPGTTNLTNQGLQRALKLATYLHTNLLNSANVNGIYALEPATRMQGGYPDMVPLEIVEQFAMLNEYSENAPQALVANSFPVNVSYSLASVPKTAATPPAYPPNCQGIDFADNGGDNEALVNGIISQKKGGYFVFALPFETFEKLLNNLKSLNSYEYAVPDDWEGPNKLYVLAVTPVGATVLNTYDTQINPGTSYPVLNPAWQDSPSSNQPAFETKPSEHSGYSLPSGINTNQTVYFIRHGEAHPNQAWDDGNLTMSGNWRALYLPAALAGKIKTPDLVYAVDPAQIKSGEPESTNPDIKTYSYVRTSQTVAPYAIANGIPFCVASEFYWGVPGKTPQSQEQSSRDAVNFFFVGGQFSNKTLLISWEHNRIPLIAQSLVNLYFANVSDAPSVPPNTSWPETDYDTIWTFSLDGSGNLTVSNLTCEGINSATLPTTPPSF